MKAVTNSENNNLFDDPTARFVILHRFCRSENISALLTDNRAVLNSKIGILFRNLFKNTLFHISVFMLTLCSSRFNLYLLNNSSKIRLLFFLSYDF